MLVSPFSRSTGTPSIPDLCSPCTCCHGPCEFTFVLTLLYLEGLVYVVFSTLSGSYSLSIFSAEFPGLWGEGFERDIPFRTKGFKVFHSLNIAQSWISVFLPMYPRGSFSGDCWGRHWSLSKAQWHRSNFLAKFL